MSIYEALGTAFVIYMTCVGIAAHGWLFIAGANRLKGRLEIGQVQEDAAVRDYLGNAEALRMGIKGIR